MESVGARAPTREIAAPARACSSPFSTSHVTSHESTATRLAIDACRRSRWEKGRRGHTRRGGTRGRVTTGGGGLFPPVAPVAATGWDGRSRARADVIDGGVVVGS